MILRPLILEVTAQPTEPQPLPQATTTALACYFILPYEICIIGDPLGRSTAAGLGLIYLATVILPLWWTKLLS